MVIMPVCFIAIEATVFFFVTGRCLSGVGTFLVNPDLTISCEGHLKPRFRYEWCSLNAQRLQLNSTYTRSTSTWLEAIPPVCYLFSSGLCSCIVSHNLGAVDHKGRPVQLNLGELARRKGPQLTEHAPIVRTTNHEPGSWAVTSQLYIVTTHHEPA